MTHWSMSLILSFLFYGCAATTATTPKTGPNTDYPCGVKGMLCTDTKPPSCCEYGICMNDGEPYCDYTLPPDPADPVTMRKKHQRLERKPGPAS